MTDKERLMKFIDNIVPNDFKCGHLSLSFSDDGSALLIIGNKEDAYNTDRITQDERERIVSWKDNGNGTISCSKCGTWFPKEREPYLCFCGWCGARMHD